MPLETRIHDVSDFPIVRFEADQAYEGYANAWCKEMDALMARQEPHVLIYLAASRQESHEDYKMRGAWLKANKGALAQKCLALIVVEPDAEKRAALEAMFPNLVRAFGTPQAARPTQAEAEALGRHVLAGGSVGDKISGPPRSE